MDAPGLQHLVKPGKKLSLLPGVGEIGAVGGGEMAEKSFGVTRSLLEKITQA